MLRKVATKVMWVGRGTVFLVGLLVILALLFGVATVALGATGYNFILGKGNSAGATTQLTSAVAGPVLKLVNHGTYGGDGAEPERAIWQGPFDGERERWEGHQPQRG